MSAKEGARLPGTKLSAKEMYSLLGLVESSPQAKYEFSAGPTISRFLQGLREGKILGRRCPRCGRIYVPPRDYCEYCHVALTDWVEVPDTGCIDPEEAKKDSTIGMKVKARWKPAEQRTGSVLDIECFEPVR